MKTYDPLSTKIDTMPTQTLRARGRACWEQLDPQERRFVNLKVSAGLTSRKTKEYLGLDRVPTGQKVTQATNIMVELRRRDPALDASDLLTEYLELYTEAKKRNQFGVCRQILDSMAKISGADQLRMEATLPTNAGAEDMALAIIAQISSGAIPLREGQELLRALEVGAKLSLTQRAIDSAPGANVDAIHVHKPGTEAWLNARKFAENLALLRAVDASPLTLVGDNNDD